MSWDLQNMESGARLLRALGWDGSSDCLFLLCGGSILPLGMVSDSGGGPGSQRQ